MGDTLMKINALNRRSFRPRGGRPVRRPGSCRGCLPPGNHQLQLGDTLVAAVGNGTARCVPREQAHLDLPAI
jgi:hypothetical protein